jgi:carboxyl-terminal processing protease
MRDDELNDAKPRPIPDTLTPERIAWVVGAFLCGALTVRLATNASVRSEDVRFAQSVAEVHRILDQRYVEPIDSDAMRVTAIDGMLDVIQRGALHDEATQYFPPVAAQQFHEMVEGGYQGIGVRHAGQLNADGYLRVETPLEGSPAAAAGVEAGDLIVAVDATSIRNMPVDEIRKLLRGEPGTRVLVTLRNPAGEERDVSITRGLVVEPVTVGYVRHPDNSWNYFVDAGAGIAYVRFSSFTINSAAPLEQRLRQLQSIGMKALILDLRGNGGGSLDEAVRMSSLFLQPGMLVVSKQGRAHPREQHYSIPGATLPDFPVVILVNEETASASEIVAGALADHARALKDDPRSVVVVGARTFGKGSVQVEQRLTSGDGSLKFTIAYWYTPNGRRVHKLPGAAEWGVEPDVVVPLDIPGRQKLAEAMEARKKMRRKDAPPGLRDDEKLDDAQLSRAIDILAAQLLPAPATQPSTQPTTRLTD